MSDFYPPQPEIKEFCRESAKLEEEAEKAREQAERENLHRNNAAEWVMYFFARWIPRKLRRARRWCTGDLPQDVMW